MLDLRKITINGVEQDFDYTNAIQSIFPLTGGGIIERRCDPDARQQRASQLRVAAEASLPEKRISSPSRSCEPISSSDETNWLDNVGSMVTLLPLQVPPSTRTGGHPLLACTSTPSCCHAATNGWIGRFCICPSPVMTQSPAVIAATDTRKRSAVPALPQNNSPLLAALAVRGPTRTVPCGSSTNSASNPSVLRPATRYRTSSLGDAPMRVMVSPDKAAATSRRLASLLLPGATSVASLGKLSG